jgi:anti-sigma B factor antagonist
LNARQTRRPWPLIGRDQAVAGARALEDPVDLVLTTTHTEGTCCVVTVQGDLDLFTAADLKDYLGGRIAAGQHNLVVDLDAVEFLDSTGIGALISVLRDARGCGGSVRLVCTNGRIVWLLGMTGVAGALPTYESHAAAVAST